MDSVNQTLNDVVDNRTSDSAVQWMIPLDNSSDTSHLVTRDMIISMNMYGLPIIILIGVLGNTLSLIIFSAGHLRHQSSSVYLAFLNFADCLFLLCLLVTQLEWYHIFLMRIAGICRLVIYISYVSAFLSVWTVVSFTVERMIAVYFPLKRLIYCTRKRAVYVVTILFIGSLVLYSFTLVTNGVQMFNDKNECMYFIQYHSLVYYSSILDTIFTMIVPSVLIIVLNFLIIFKVWKHLHSKWRSSYASETAGMTTAEERLSKESCDHRKESLPGASGEEQQQERYALQPLVTRNEAQPLKQENSEHGSNVTRYNNHTRRYTFSGCLGRKSASASCESQTRDRHSSNCSAINRVNLTNLNPRSNAIQLRTTRTLLIISTLFVLFNLPSHTFRVWVTLNPPTEVPSEKLLLGQLFFQFLYYLNFSSNLFLYCACSQMFRKELKNLLAKVWYKITGLFGRRD